MAGRYIEPEAFCARMEAIISRQVYLYRRDPPLYVKHLPILIHGYFHERSPNKKISLACLLAETLIATGRRPTGEYIWRLMNDNGILPGSPEGVWQMHQDRELTPILALSDADVAFANWAEANGHQQWLIEGVWEVASELTPEERLTEFMKSRDKAVT